MKRFKDNHQTPVICEGQTVDYKPSPREWMVNFTVESAKRLLTFDPPININDVFELGDKNLIARLYSDIILLVNVAYAICEPQAIERGVTDVDFGRSLSGDSVEEIRKAIVSEIFDFFPKARREILKGLNEKVEKIQELRQQQAMTILQSPKMDEQIKKIAQISITTAGNLPE